MKMMVDTAKAANGVQFILITPQDMGVRYFVFLSIQRFPLRPASPYTRPVLAVSSSFASLMIGFRSFFPPCRVSRTVPKCACPS
jgi:hypothetical protein